ECRQAVRIGGYGVASPDDIKIRAHQDEVIAVDVAWRRCFDRQLLEGRAARTHRPPEAGRVGRAAAESQERVAVADRIVDRTSFVEPDVRQSRAGPRRRNVFTKQLLGPAGLLPDDWRANVAIAQFG